MAQKIMYKNHCTPQEQISSGGRYYLDSDCGRKLTGNEEFTLGSGTTAYTSTDTVSNSDIVTVANDKDFVFIKNLGGGSGDDILIALNGTGTAGAATEYSLKLSSGEALALELRHDASVDDTTVKVKCDSGKDSTIEYFTGT